MNQLIQSHNELLSIVQAYVAVNGDSLTKSPYLKNKIEGAITRGIKTKKSIAATID